MTALALGSAFLIVAYAAFDSLAKLCIAVLHRHGRRRR